MPGLGHTIASSRALFWDYFYLLGDEPVEDADDKVGECGRYLEAEEDGAHVQQRDWTLVDELR